MQWQANTSQWGGSKSQESHEGRAENEKEEANETEEEIWSTSCTICMEFKKIKAKYIEARNEYQSP